MVEFWRYCTENCAAANSHQYKIDSKLRQAAKTAHKHLAKRIEELGLNPNIWTFDALEDLNSDLDDNTWFELHADDQIKTAIKKIKKHKFSKDSFHSPPLKRGIYVFPPKFVEWFLVSWKGSKLKKSIIDFYGPSLWCHHKEIAIELGVQVLREKGSWVEIETQDYKRVLAKAIAERVSEIRKGRGPSCKVSAKNLKYYTDISEFEVFLVL